MEASDGVKHAILTIARELGRLERENAALKAENAELRQAGLVASSAIPAPRARRKAKLKSAEQSRARLLHRERPA